MLEIVAPAGASAEVKDAFESIKRKLNIFDKLGLIMSARFLRHYMNNKGVPINLPSVAMNDISVVQDGILTNRKRFEDSLVKSEVGSKKPLLSQALLKIKEGQTVILKDYWDVDHQKSLPNSIKDPDFLTAIGGVKIRSHGEIIAMRRGKQILIEMKVIHSFENSYDFTGGKDNSVNENFFDKERLLAKVGLDKVFWVNWKQNETGQGTINFNENGNVRDFVFGWPKNGS